jgi:hypothetical protein
MKQKNLFVILIIIMSAINLSTVKAQDLSLSFSLTETDNLADMIADSKKYDISSLTLSGYVNENNIKYIQDLNTNGNLQTLDLSDVTHICTYYKKTVNYTFSPKYEAPEYRWYDKSVGELKSFLKKIGIGLQGSCPFEGHNINNGINTSFNIYVTITEEYTDDNLFVTLKSSYKCPAGDDVTGSKTITKAYSLDQPKLTFQDNSFSKLDIPNSITSIGNTDCRFRVKSCGEYVLGNHLTTIGENAFLGSVIGTLTPNSTISEIRASAFENTMGNILANPQFLEQVEYIGEGAFRNSALLENVVGEITMKANRIDKYAFQDAILPNTISLPNIEFLGENAFKDTAIEHIGIGDKLASLDNETFANCSHLQTFTGGANINSIGDGTFSGCKELKSFTPSATLATIGKEAFANNSALTKFSIPNKTNEIGFGAFQNSGLKKLELGQFGDYRRDIDAGCDSLEVFSVSANNEKLRSEEGVLLSKDGSKIIAYPYAKKDAIYEISNDVTEIVDSAFYGVNQLRALVIAESVEKIGKFSFANSSIIEVKALPSKTPIVTDNGTGLDQDIVRLFVREKDYSTYYVTKYWGDFKNIFVFDKAVSTDDLITVEKAGTLPGYIGFGGMFRYKNLCLAGSLNSDDIRYLREMAGRDVRGNETTGVLSDLDFSQASIIDGGEYYYYDPSVGKLTTSDDVIGDKMFEGCSFKRLVVSETATKIGDKALYGCLLVTFRIPATTKDINQNSFFGMNTLQELVVEENNISYQSHDGVLFTKDGKTLLLYPYGKEGERYCTPVTTTCIGEQAFGGTNLKVVVTNEGLTEIKTLAFDCLSSLEGISLPSSLGRIGHRAFWGCTNLMNISCNAYYPPTLEYNYYSYSGQLYNNFSDTTYENAVLTVPQKNGGYQSRSGWNLFKNFIEKDNKGDANGDGEVDENDINAIVEYLMNGKTEVFNFNNADANVDQKVNVADIVEIINKMKK